MSLFLPGRTKASIHPGGLDMKFRLFLTDFTQAEHAGGPVKKRQFNLFLSFLSDFSPCRPAMGAGVRTKIGNFEKLD
jgi:hypothetical protein